MLKILFILPLALANALNLTTINDTYSTFSANDSNLVEYNFNPVNPEPKAMMPANNLQTRQPAPLVMYGGNFIHLRIVNRGNTPRTCTLGWAVKRTKGQGQFPHGYLTTASCLPAARDRTYAFVKSHEGEAVTVGKLSRSSNVHYPEDGLDFSVIKIDPGFWDPNLSMNTWFHFNPPTLVPTLEANVVPIEGNTVCFFGAQSQHVCGKIIDLDVNNLEQLRPWVNRLGYREHVYFNHLVMVRMEGDHLTRAQTIGRHSDDAGSPVYVPKLQNGFLVGAHPVGILQSYAVGPVTIFGVDLPIPQNHPHFFYTKLKEFLDLQSLELITDPKQPAEDK